MKARGQYKKSCTNYQDKETKVRLQMKNEREIWNQKYSEWLKRMGVLRRNYSLHAGEFQAHSYRVLA